MELYTFINKKTGDVIRFNKEQTGCSEFGTIYYFTDFELHPAWFATKEESINFLLSKKFIHPLYSQMPETPDFGKISLDDYEIRKVSL